MADDPVSDLAETISEIKARKGFIHQIASYCKDNYSQCVDEESKETALHETSAYLIDTFNTVVDDIEVISDQLQRILSANEEKTAATALMLESISQVLGSSVLLTKDKCKIDSGRSDAAANVKKNKDTNVK
mmetsp:Transcript_15145/g.24751  ORF Transcript_15145/g.24751 Transcript_15145/m.24751 type:complete len:131 (+) Transcript_15145:42-434(+)|eukprot:CAMPEP_0206363306 /NCGR_PEP_ID=MMETSP0294-20121207/1517_1 /ASSEMBLY_ACC=CAM_ASM_000327 /TAXON_ID=39354 /ORGANISM="Heterosigma akashiwo, Strain CCMP2393" /LENGTH=130 /DNA_ID=CAMNT_0053808633 /DNA_START=56 /DNA_END=448 /DNA_ORIENTATION=-